MEAAYMTELPSGTLTVTPSTSSVTCFSVDRLGVPRSMSVMDCITVSLGQIQCCHIFNAEILRKVPDGAENGIGNKPAQPAERSVQHHVAQIPQEIEVRL